MKLVAMAFAGLASGFAAFRATAAFADADGAGRWGHHDMMGWGGWFYGPLMMVVFFALLIGAVILIVRLLGVDRNGHGDRPPGRALDILRERFARGEITKDEFEEARKVLE